MGANIAGIYGAQIFRRDDRPHYRRAFAVACAVLAFGLVVAVACAVLAFGLVVAVGRYVSDKVRGRKKARQVDDGSSSDGEVSNSQPADDQPAPIVDGRRPSITAGKL
jgi:hypothetical protein